MVIKYSGAGAMSLIVPEYFHLTAWWSLSSDYSLDGCTVRNTASLHLKSERDVHGVETSDCGYCHECTEEHTESRHESRDLREFDVTTVDKVSGTPVDLIKAKEANP